MKPSPIDYERLKVKIFKKTKTFCYLSTFENFTPSPFPQQDLRPKKKKN